MVTRGYEQLVLSVKGAKKIATRDRFDSLLKNVVPDDSSPDLSELRKLIDIKTAHESFACRLFPQHNDWYDAIALLALTHRPNKEGHRLCPACFVYSAKDTKSATDSGNVSRSPSPAFRLPNNVRMRMT